MQLPKDLSPIKKNVSFSILQWNYGFHLYLQIDFDENVNDLDFDESLEKTSTTISTNELIKTGPTKTSQPWFEMKLLKFSPWKLGNDHLLLTDHAGMAIDFKGEGSFDNMNINISSTKMILFL